MNMYYKCMCIQESVHMNKNVAFLPVTLTAWKTISLAVEAGH